MKLRVLGVTKSHIQNMMQDPNWEGYRRVFKRSGVMKPIGNIEEIKNIKLFQPVEENTNGSKT